MRKVACNKLKYYCYLCINLFFIGFAHTSIDNFIYKYKDTNTFSNYSTLGLIQNPSARFHPSGTIAFSWSDVDPYYRGSIVAYPFDWFEASYQYTDINNALYSLSENFSGSQSYKDKGFDFKFRILKESRTLPQVAIGIRDVAGSGKFAAEYVTASKMIIADNFYYDFTLGLGWGGLSYGEFSNPLSRISDSFKIRSNPDSDTQGGEFNFKRYFSGNVGLFGGVEIFIPNLNGTRLKVEYDGTNYDVEGFPFGAESSRFAFEPVRKSQSRINFGVVYPINRSLHLKGAFIKGNTFNLGFSYSGFWRDRNPVRKKRDPIIKVENSEIVKEVTASDNLLFYRAALVELGEQGIFLQHANISEDKLDVAFSQIKYNDSDIVIGRISTTLDQISPDYINTFSLTDVNAGMFLNNIDVDRRDFSKFQEDNLFPLGKRSLDIKPAHKSDKDFEYNPSAGYPSSFWKFSPMLRSQIGGPDGFYFGELSIGFNSETKFAPNISLVAEAQVGLGNNFGELKLKSDSVLPHVRSDIVLYLKESQDYNIRRLQLNIFNNPLRDVYTKISAGILEDMFVGAGGEVLYRPFDQSFAIGMEAWSVKQRDYDMLFDTLPYETVTGHLNFYYLMPKTNILFNLKGGKYLAKDSGFTFDFSRDFPSGVRIGAFFSLTDISKAEFGEGSFDKGFYFHIPLDIFSEKYITGTSGFGLKPLTRDGAAILNPSYNLFGVTYESQRAFIDRYWSELYE